MVIGSRSSRRNFGLSSPTRPRNQDAGSPLAVHSEEMILAPRPRRRQQVARILFWLGMLATIAAGVIYLYLTHP